MSRSSATVLFPLVLSLLLMASSNDEVVFGDKAEGEIGLSAVGGVVPAKLVLQQTKLPESSAYTGDGLVVTVYEPTSHLFWWIFERRLKPGDLNAEKAEFLGGTHFGVEKDRIVGFSGEGRSLWVRASSSRASSLKAALDEVHRELRKDIPEVVSGSKWWWQPLALSQVLGSGYFAPKTAGDIGGPARHGLQVKSVVKRTNGWRIEVANDYGEARIVVVDDSLTSATEDTAH